MPSRLSGSWSILGSKSAKFMAIFQAEFYFKTLSEVGTRPPPAHRRENSVPACDDRLIIAIGLLVVGLERTVVELLRRPLLR